MSHEEQDDLVERLRSTASVIIRSSMVGGVKIMVQINGTPSELNHERNFYWRSFLEPQDQATKVPVENAELPDHKRLSWKTFSTAGFFSLESLIP